MDRSGAIKLFIDYFVLILLFLSVTNQQASFSSGTILSRGHQKLGGFQAGLHRDTRSPTSGSLSAARLNTITCSKPGTDFAQFHSSCFMCALSADLRESACPSLSRPVGDAVRACTLGSPTSVFSFEGCNFECVLTTSRSERECCPGYWAPFCSMECPSGSLYPCSSHGVCDDGRNGTGSCTCDDGYTGIYCQICRRDSCPEKKACVDNLDCHYDAACEYSTWDDGQLFCRCLDGYRGDGVECYAINPCLDDTQLCSDTSVCVHDGPNQYHCECKPGYTEFQEGCFLNECHDNATLRSCGTGRECATVSPGRVVCQCGPGYVGNGTVCYGNIMERVEHLNGGEGNLAERLTQSLLLLEASSMHLWLRDTDVFYTVFLPVDEAPQFHSNSELVALLEAGLSGGSDVRANVFLETVAKVHIVPGYVDSDMLHRMTGLYTLAGKKISVGQGSTNITIALEGSEEVAKVIHSDLPASNGVIHIIDRVLLPPAEDVKTRAQGSILDVLSTYDNLGTYTGMIKSYGILRDVLQSEEGFRTLFAVTDDALLDIGPEITSLILSTGMWEQFVGFYIYHLMNPHLQLSAHDMMKAGEIQTYPDYILAIQVSENGRITLAERANITIPDIPAANGVIHIIDSILLDSSFFAFPEVCFRNQTDGQNQECCEGFYSPSCFSCRDSCVSGQCDDGVEGSGRCICDPAFDGVECIECRDSSMYGPYCNKTCSCIHGECDTWAWGAGHCRIGTCSPGYMGEDCHLQTIPCGPQEDQCHTHSTCLLSEGVQRCVCNEHYTGNGTDCIPINPCQLPNQRLCDPYMAECIYTGPGMHRCRCKEGHEGERTSCTPRDRCLIDNGGCHRDATCLHTFSLDLIQCVCSFGFEGDGYACEPINACLRPHDCDAEALCESTGPGTYSCICPPGWAVGNDKSCYSNLAVELSSLSEAEPFWQMIQAVSLDGYISHTNHSLGVVVPSPHMIQLINSSTEGALGIQRIMAYFVRSNMFMLDKTQRYQNWTLPSLQPGENVVIDGPYGNLSLINGHLAYIENATNGLIFQLNSYPKNYWINRLAGKMAHLSPSSGDVQDYSQAWQMIQASGLLPLDDATPYTVFLPDNIAMSTLNLSAVDQDDFLQHHLVIGKTLYYHNLSEELNITTASGQHLHFSASNKTTFVDMIPIAAPDIPILPNGVAHGIPGLLSSSLREGTCEDGMNGGCHQRARCMQKTSTMLQCRCLAGYHGDGMDCVLSDPCFHDNGGCHFRASCNPVGPDERRCSCQYGYEGDGFICFGSIMEELRSMPEASLFVELVENLDSRSFLMSGEGRHTVFVPSNRAVTAFLQHQDLREDRYTYLLKQYVLYHVIAGSHMTMADLHNHTILGMMNGQDLDVATNQNGNIILGADGSMVSANYNASNGIIHMIDTMLLPPKLYEWPNEQNMGIESGEEDRRRYPSFREDMGVLGTSHNISTFLRLLQLTPMFQEFFLDARPRPGHGGPPPRGPPPGQPPQGMAGGHDGGRRDGRGRMGYRDGPDGMSTEESSHDEEPFDGYQRSGGMQHGDASGRYHARGGGGGGGGHRGGRGIHGRHGRGKRGGMMRLTDRDEDRHQHKRACNHHGHHQKRSLDPPRGGPPRGGPPRGGPPRGGPSPGRHAPHGFRHGGRLDRDNTIFAPSDEAFRRLPPGKLEELGDADNRMLLQEFIAHHVLPEERSFDDLWPKTGPYVAPSLQGSDLRLSIMRQGQLFVNERSRVIGVGLKFEGGVLYPVSEVISLPTMDGRCDDVRTYSRMSRCKRCGSPLCPPSAEQVGAEEQGCRYDHGWYSSRIGCRAECQFTEVIRACCQGYYGPSCQECPGGSVFPCNNHGRCNEGYDNDGECSCHKGFTGTACERCLPGFYGPSCRKCRCSNSSICYGDSGECFCSADRSGPFCEHVLSFLPTCDPPCHQNAVCRLGNRCQCSPQYHGDGYTCNAINHCFSENGGCSIHATCTHNASALSANCTCHEGYHGDGIVCLPVNLCEENNGGCHVNAQCIFRGPNARNCVCRPPYWGDGLECHSPVTSCLANNGGCSPNAHCREGENGDPIECSCFDGYVGNGVICNSNLYDTIASQPEFYYFFEMVMQLANESRAGKRLVKDLQKPRDPLTIFIPRNPKLSGLTFYPSQVLLHVVHGRWSREELFEEGYEEGYEEGDEEGDKLETWSGQELNLDVTHDENHQAVVTIENVPVVRFGMEATNGVIHMIEAPLPIYIVNYDDDDDHDDDDEFLVQMGWNSTSRIFAAVAVPLGLFAFIIVVILYWYKSRKLRELTRRDLGQAIPTPTPTPTTTTTTSDSVQGAEASRATIPMTSTEPSPPVSPVSSLDQGDIQYSEIDQLMSEETGEKRETRI